jgi:hypothetical protein
MSIITEFLTTGKDLLSWASKLQRTQQEQILSIVGGLADELSRSITLLTVYLDGIRGMPDEHLPGYLRTGRQKVLQSFREFQICGGLLTLKNRFGSLLDPSTLSVNAGNIGAMSKLVDQLAGGERMIFDDLEQIFAELDDFAARIEDGQARSVGEADVNRIRSELADRVDGIKEQLRQANRQITDTARSIVDAIR